MAEEYFPVGMEWHIERTYTYTLPFPKFHMLMRVEESQLTDGRDGKVIVGYEQGYRRVMMEIDQQGERIYFNQNQTSPEWKLLYDFGVQEGDTLKVYYPVEEMQDSCRYYQSALVRCLGRDESLGAMVLAELCNFYGNSKEYENAGRRTTWVIGMGSYSGPHKSTAFGIQWDGPVSRLDSCLVNGEVIFRSSRFKSKSPAQCD